MDWRMKMNLRTDIRSVSYVKANAAELLRHVNESRNPIVITQDGEAKGVLLDAESFQEMKNALGILKLISQSENDIRRGNVLTHEDAVSSARKIISDKV